MKKFYFYLPAIFVLILILAACAAPPIDDMNRAHDAVIRAENDADAVAFAPNALIRARDALTRMQAEADAKRYDAAKNFAAEAISNAERAIAEGRGGGGRARDEAQSLINSLAGPLEETSNAISTAWESQAIQLNFGALFTDMESARRTYEDARQSLQANNFPGAITQGQTVRSILADINAQLTGAAQAVSRK